MKYSFYNIKTNLSEKVLIKLIISALIIGVLLTGCGGSSNSENTLTPDFFTKEIKGEITVSAYDSMIYRNYLEEAARLFEQLYPGVKVNIETFSAMPEVRTSEDGNMMMSLMTGQDAPQARTDYLNRVNTGIMSGTGADIYAMDIIPLKKFTESGTLENLDLYMNMDAGFNKSDYRRNIIEASRYNGGIWFLPIDYSFNYYAYDSTLVDAQTAAAFGTDKAWNAERLINIGIPLFDETYKIFNTTDYSVMGGGMFRQLLNESIRSFVNLETSRANFTDGAFTGLLESVKNYGEKGYIPQAVSVQPNAAPNRQLFMEAPTDRFFFKQNGSANLLGQFMRGSGLMIGIRNAGVAAAIEDDDEIAGIQALSDGSVPYNYSQAYGINSQSKNKETAWAFLKFLLSNEIQSSTYLNFTLPLNNEARSEKAELTINDAFSRMGGSLNEQQYEALENYKEAMEKLSDSINTFVIQDTSVNDMIASEVQYYFNGTRTAEEVARVIQNKVDLYINE